MNLISKISNDDKKLNYIDSIGIVYLPEIYVRTLRDTLIELYAKSDDPIWRGYTAPGNLSYTIENVRNIHNKYKNKETRVIFKAAFILYNLVFGHPFADGNKRTGVITANSFLEYNGYSILTLPFRKSKEFLLLVAQGKKTEKDCRRFIKEHIQKLEINKETKEAIIELTQKIRVIEKINI